MTEQTPEAPAAAGDQTTDQTAAAPSDANRYAVYDDTYKRYIGGVSDKRPSKADVKRIAGEAGGKVDVDNLSIREV